MLIEVIPLGGSIDDRAITYFVSDELSGSIQLGCLVEVPFHNALDSAVVTGVETLPKWAGGLREQYEELVGLRSISRIVTTLPLLSPYQIDTIFSLSSYYLVRLHQILSLFLHKSLVKYFEKKDFDDFRAASDPERIGVTASKKTKKTPAPAIFFHHHTGSNALHSALSGLIRDRSVVIFPDDYSMEAYLNEHPPAADILVVPDRLTETKKHKAFRDVYNGEKNIIIWTRRILYYNLRAYDHLFYMEDSLHRTQMRFQHTYKHLETLRRMVPGPFNATILSSLPSIESMYLLHTGIYMKSE